MKHPSLIITGTKSKRRKGYLTNKITNKKAFNSRTCKRLNTSKSNNLICIRQQEDEKLLASSRN